MRYVLVSDVDHGGGAAIAAARLASALVARGHDVHWVSARTDGLAHEWHSVPFRRTGWRRALHGFAQHGPAALRRHLQASFVDRPLRRMLEALAPDVVNIHNVHGAGWQPSVLDAVPDAALAIWTLHDMWSMTGRCAYAYDCRQYLEGCSSTCPTPQEYPALDPRHIAASWASRAARLASRPTAVAVAPSTWLAREARAGLWRHHRVAHIPNGVPADVYFPIARATARQALGLDPHARVVAVMAEKLEERRKGWTYLHDALGHLPEPLHVLLIGRSGAQIRLPPPHTGTAVGRVDHPAALRTLLNAAECLVHPAPVDNLPNVVLEALACGLPTVAFAVGGLPDMVRPGISGWLSPDLTATGLAVVLAEALASLPAPNMERDCRELATKEYGLDLQARRYEQLAAGSEDDLVEPGE